MSDERDGEPDVPMIVIAESQDHPETSYVNAAWDCYILLQIVCLESSV